MLRSIDSALRNRLPHPTVVYAWIRALFASRRLPPGKLVRFEQLEKADRHFLLNEAARLGPVFKGTHFGRFYVCVIGLPLGRRLLREHGADLTPRTIDMRSLFPHGFLRQMRGETHRRYRKALVHAIRPENVAASLPHLETIATRGLADYAANQPRNDRAPDAYVATLNAISSGMLIHLFFGAEFGSPAFERLLQSYRRLGPSELVWTIGPAEREAFAEIRDFLLAQFTAPSAGDTLSRHSIAGEMHADGVLDATALGNLIYMVEMGRFDVYSLFRWLTKYAAEHPEYLERIAREAERPPQEGRTFADAFVQETLRMDQSERLMRNVTRTFVFDGYLIPKHAIVRVCLWESHKSAESFPDPMRFDPTRFTEGDPSGDEFSPFGLDHHHCPLADVTVQLSTVFLRALARGYTIEAVEDGMPVRGTYHWQPAHRFSVELRARNAASTPERACPESTEPRPMRS